MKRRRPSECFEVTPLMRYAEAPLRKALRAETAERKRLQWALRDLVEAAEPYRWGSSHDPLLDTAIKLAERALAKAAS